MLQGIRNSRRERHPSRRHSCVPVETRPARAISGAASLPAFLPEPHGTRDRTVCDSGTLRARDLLLNDSRPANRKALPTGESVYLVCLSSILLVLTYGHRTSEETFFA